MTSLMLSKKIILGRTFNAFSFWGRAGMFSLICVQFSFLCAIVLILFYLHGLKDSRNTVFIYPAITISQVWYSRLEAWFFRAGCSGDMDLQEGTLAGHSNGGLHWQWKCAFESGLSDGRADSTACGVVFFLRSVLGVT